jgi:hypothetical protein
MAIDIDSYPGDSPMTLDAETLVLAVRNWPTAAPGPTADELATTLEVEAKEARAAAEVAVTDGLLDAWDLQGLGRHYVLSPLTADRLGVKLFAPEDGDFRWMPVGWESKPRPERHKTYTLTDALGLACPNPGPAEVAAEGEEAEGLLRRMAAPSSPTQIVGFLPMPSRLLGTAVPWSGPIRATSCPVCQGKELDPRTYCMACDAWGLQHLIGRVIPPPAESILVARRTSPLFGGLMARSAKPTPAKASKRAVKPAGRTAPKIEPERKPTRKERRAAMKGQTSAAA